MFYGVLTETVLMVFLLYTPGVNGVFGGRYSFSLIQATELLPAVPWYALLNSAAGLGGNQKGLNQHEE